ncbi:MAG TPA: hypothetical protein VII43_08235 [Opitutaceae bacterium]
MNAQNALTFAILGAAMEILPVLFPSWFPRCSADHASTRALWLSFMGAIQIALAVGFILGGHVFPFFARFASTASGRNALPLPSARGLTSR